LPKKVSSDFSYTLTYLTLKYERNQIFHPRRGILILSDFYRQALLISFMLEKKNKKKNSPSGFSDATSTTPNIKRTPSHFMLLR